MTPHGFGQHQRRSEHHMMLASVMVLLSVVIHVVCMYVLSDFALGGVSGLRTRMHDRFVGERVPPMRVETMRADPMRIAERIMGERDMPSRGPIEAGENVDALSQSSSPVLTVPPPIPREALAPGVPALREVVTEKIDITPWMPRQEIAQIFDRTVQDDVAALPRREIPLIERVSKAPDIVPSIDLAGQRFGRDPEPPKAFEAAEIFDTKIEKGTFKPPVAEVPEPASKVSTGATEARFAVQPGEKSNNTGAVAGAATGAAAGAVAGAVNGAATGAAAGGDAGTASGTTQDTVAGAASGTTTGTAPATEAERLRQAQQERLQKQMEEEAARARAATANTPAADEEERKAQDAQAQIAALQKVVDYVPIDDLLAVGLETFRDPDQSGRLYFRVGIQPRTDKRVPVVAKDIVFVQDVSASMTEERMVYCRRGLVAALGLMNPGDRFNVVAFRDSFATCFPEWATVTEENIKKATTFVSGMRAFGQTDLFGSMRLLMRLPRDPKRPMLAIAITDGKPTFGMTESAQIIGEFSKLNSGMVSIYMYGTQSKANVYLLDMLTYCNRGASTVLSGSKWEIPGGMQSMVESVRNPVMSDITVTFDSASKSEVYPKNSTNLYKDRQLELCGVCPDTTGELVFQIRGLAADKGYDSIFRLNMARHARESTVALKQRWARQKMIHLVGEYSRDARQEIMAEMLKLNAQYGLPIPYESELK